ncbi:MAG TPA: hypothetical protein VFA09_18540 [Ktedonobacteraceae bacterium]|jgi:hypothetical protein|nr:hypothetical protein [Ktedonobacteraceae bacterium]
MQLPPDQTERFYHIWFLLLYYINEQRHIIAPFPNDPKITRLDPQDVMKIRDVLWKDDTLRKDFIAENPARLPNEDLAIVESWQHRVSGKFFVVRYLKKYTVFLSETPARAYGVLGLYSPIEEILGPYLPIYIEAVLLPLEDHIIYDSLLAPFSIYFGPGIRSTLNDSYRDAQEREGIITNLLAATSPENVQEIQKGIMARNKRIVSVFRKDLASRGLSNAMVEKHVGNIDAFARDYLLSQDPPRGLLTMTMEDLETYMQTVRDKTTLTSFKRFLRFLDDTGRMDYEQITALRDLLKHVNE